MLWRVRATLPDRPGALAALAQRCGEAGVNILGMQIFPGLEQVTDEFVL
ncbi:UTP:GlnB (protein PII) uridylyltransferase, partial [Nocardioides luteus]